MANIDKWHPCQTYQSWKRGLKQLFCNDVSPFEAMTVKHVNGRLSVRPSTTVTTPNIATYVWRPRSFTAADMYRSGELLHFLATKQAGQWRHVSTADRTKLLRTALQRTTGKKRPRCPCSRLEAYRTDRRIDPLVLNLGTRRNTVVRSTLRPL